VNPPLLPEEKSQLLAIARQAVEATAAGLAAAPLDPSHWTPRLLEPGSSFVTLMKLGALRGCLGSLQASYPLAEDIQRHAVAVCRQDYRFPPVEAHEVADLQIELSVLSEPLPLVYASPEDLIGRLQPLRDGVVLRRGLRQATFLPRVWERLPDPVQFLDLLCQKADLPQGAWRTPQVEILTYRAEDFSE
jgi:AmmeMemoRadiSam system protein A